MSTRNATCLCGSGKKYKRCCLPGSGKSIPTPHYRRVIEPERTAPPIPSLDQQARIAAAVHYAVCEETQSDGLGKCLQYAACGQGLIGRITGSLPYLQGGSLQIVADPPDGVVMMDASNGGAERGEFHAWLSYPATSPTNRQADLGQLIDLASRHFRRYTEELYQTQPGDLASVTWTRPDPPDWIWDTTGYRPESWAYRSEYEICETLNLLCGAPHLQDSRRRLWHLALDHYRRHA